MRSLTFTCPRTGRAIHAGIDTDPASLSSVQTVVLHFTCTYCGMAHQFPIKSGYLAQPLYWPSARSFGHVPPNINGPSGCLKTVLMHPLFS